MLFKTDNPNPSFCMCLILVFHTTSGYVSETGMVSQENATRYFFQQNTGVALDTAFAYRFFGQDFHRFFINGHGMIGIGADYHCCFVNYHVRSPRIMTIAAYMQRNQQSDDLLNAKVFYEEMSVEKSPSEFLKVADDIKWSFPNYEGSVNKMIVATWRNIPHYGDPIFKHLRNTFQTILASDNNNTFVVFNYNKIEWPAHDSSRDPLEAGIYGRQSHPSERYLLPGSYTYSLVYLSGMSNIDKPGKFVFKVDSRIEFPSVERKCAPIAKLPPFIDVKPRIVPVAGITPVVLSGVSICSDYNVTKITCAYIEETSGFNMKVSGVVIPGNLAIVCQTPEMFNTLGKHRLKIQVEFSHNKTVDTEAYIFVTEITDALSNTVETGTFYVPHPATNMYPKELLYITTNLIGRRGRDSVPRLVTVSITVFTQSQWKEVYRMDASEGQRWVHIPQTVRETYFQDSTDIKTRLCATYHILLNNFKTITTETVYDIDPKSFARRNKYVCSHNFSNKTIEKYTIAENLQCPVTVDQANLDVNFNEMRLSKHNVLPIITFVHIPGGENASVVCVYNKTTKLLQLSTEFNYSGSAKNPTIKYTIWEDFLEEYVRYLECCSLSNFTRVQLSQNQLTMNYNYTIPKPFQVIGSSQITNTDGTTIVLTGGQGVFWLFRSKRLSVQIFTQSLEPQLEHSAAVVKHVMIFSNDVMFQVSIAPEGLQFRMNNLPVNFYANDTVRGTEYLYEDFTIHGEKFTAKLTGSKHAIFKFHHGVYLDFVPCTSASALNMLGYIQVEKFENITGMLSEVRIGMSPDFSTFVHEWRVSNENIFFPIGEVLFNNSWRNNHKIEVKRPHELIASGSNVSFCPDSTSCKIDIILSGNEDLAECSIEISATFEELQRVAQYNISNFASTQEMTTTPLPNPEKNEESLEETNSDESDQQTDYNSLEVYSHFVKTLETSQKPTFQSEYITNTKAVNSGEQDSTTKTYTTLYQPDNEILPYIDIKLILIVNSVLIVLVLCILAFAGTFYLYIRVRKNARLQSEVALNWVIQYKP